MCCAGPTSCSSQLTLEPYDQNFSSHLLPVFISHRSSGEKLIKYQANSSCEIMSIILMTTMFYKVGGLGVSVHPRLYLLPQNFTVKIFWITPNITYPVTQLEETHFLYLLALRYVHIVVRENIDFIPTIQRVIGNLMGQGGGGLKGQNYKRKV